MISASVWALTGFAGIPVAVVFLCMLLSDVKYLQKLGTRVSTARVRVGRVGVRLDVGLLGFYSMMFALSTRKLMKKHVLER